MDEDLGGLEVWLTRPGPGGEESESAWEAAGAMVHLAPVLETLERFPEPAQLALLERDAPTGLVVTSGNAAHYLLHWLASDPDYEWIAQAPVFAVGDATADRCRSLGLSVELVAQEPSGATLAVELSSHDLPEQLLFPASARRLPSTVEALSKLDSRVRELTLYEPRVVPYLDDATLGQVDRDEFDLVLLYSPSAAEALTQLVPSADRLPCAALGATTARAAEQLGLTLAMPHGEGREAAWIEAAALWWNSSS